MLITAITFAIFVALWGFSGVAVSFAKRSLAAATARPRPTGRPAARQAPRPVAARSAASRTRGTRPVASA